MLGDAGFGWGGVGGVGMDGWKLVGWSDFRL